MPRKKTLEQFIKEAEIVHGAGKYDYSKTVYVNNNTQVEIICPIHGSYFQLPRSHVSAKCGCPKCSKVYSDQEYFIQRAKEIHGNKYDYSKVEYKNSTTKVCIICSAHGEFWQTPNAHINGSGCPKCYDLKRSENRSKIFGICINDCQGLISDDENNECYNTWVQMLRRCYDLNLKKKYPTYKDCTVCEEWLFFSNFKKWFENPENGFRKGYFLDKDLLIKGNKIYSPETCVFIPREISSITTQSNALRGELPIGISKMKNGKYRVRFSKRNKLVGWGSFDTVEAAFLSYKMAKERHARELAEEYRSQNKISERAYYGLCNFKIDITD